MPAFHQTIQRIAFIVGSPGARCSIFGNAWYEQRKEARRCRRASSNVDGIERERYT